jgi:hypothetical protein
MRQAVAFQPAPVGAAIVRHVDCAGWAAAEHGVGMHLHLPHAREQRVGIVGVDIQTGASGVGIDEQRAAPVSTPNRNVRLSAT